jgi:hypothetical protein
VKWDYDAENINTLPNNIIRVWLKMYPTSEEGRLRFMMRERSAGRVFRDNWGFTIMLYEINCRNKTYTAMRGIDYSIKNEVMFSAGG